MSSQSHSIPAFTDNSLEKSPCTIFLIEDDRDDRVLARKELAKSDYVEDVICFKDGEELSQYMKDNGYIDKSVLLNKPILILVDLEMPRKDGLAVIQDLKKDVFLQDIPLIVISGTTSQDKINQAKELGANGVFPKPLKVSMLEEFYKDAWKWPPNDLW